MIQDDLVCPLVWYTTLYCMIIDIFYSFKLFLSLNFSYLLDNFSYQLVFNIVKLHAWCMF